MKSIEDWMADCQSQASDGRKIVSIKEGMADFQSEASDSMKVKYLLL